MRMDPQSGSMKAEKFVFKVLFFSLLISINFVLVSPFKVANNVMLSIEQFFCKRKITLANNKV